SLCTCFCVTDPSSSELYTLSLHDALPILLSGEIDMTPIGSLDPAHYDVLKRELEATGKGSVNGVLARVRQNAVYGTFTGGFQLTDRKSTRLNSSHVAISYAVFCLKKKN